MVFQSLSNHGTTAALLTVSNCSGITPMDLNQIGLGALTIEGPHCIGAQEKSAFLKECPIFVVMETMFHSGWGEVAL